MQPDRFHMRWRRPHNDPPAMGCSSIERQAAVLAAAFLVLFLGPLSMARSPAFNIAYTQRSITTDKQPEQRAADAGRAATANILLEAGRLRVRIDPRSGKIEVSTSSGTHVASTSALHRYGPG